MSAPDDRDARPAVGTAGEPAAWQRASEGADVGGQRSEWADAAWSHLYTEGTRYAATEPAPGQVAAASRRARGGALPDVVQGPVVNPPVWTWEVPLYFWFGGIAAGSSVVAVACDAAGDGRSAATARSVALASALLCPPLLIADLGRPARFLNMLRILKPRSPMSTGAWCLAGFSTAGAGAVAADVTGRPRAARTLGAATGVLGGYLGSYTGVLLATTAVPVWARSRLLLGPIFMATATATGAAASRLALVARRLPADNPTDAGLRRIETGAIAAELLLAKLNERRLGDAAEPLHAGRSGRRFRIAKALVTAGLGLRLLRRRIGRPADQLTSAAFLAGGLVFRYAWIEAGRASARDDVAVARTARAFEPPAATAPPQAPTARAERRGAPAAGAAYADGVRRLSLRLERLLRR